MRVQCEYPGLQLLAGLVSFLLKFWNSFWKKKKLGLLHVIQPDDSLSRFKPEHFDQPVVSLKSFPRFPHLSHLSGSILGVFRQAQPTSARTGRAKVKVMLSAAVETGVHHEPDCCQPLQAGCKCRQARQARQARQHL